MNSASRCPRRSGEPPAFARFSYCRRLPCRSCNALMTGVNTSAPKPCPTCIPPAGPPAARRFIGSPPAAEGFSGFFGGSRVPVVAYRRGGAQDPRRSSEAIMADEFPSLFTPVDLGRLTLKNRIYSSGHAEAMAEGGRPTERLRHYHAAKARGGCALTIFGGSSSVHPSSPAAAWKQIANHDDTIVPEYRAIADAVHRHDCLVFTQLTHLGRRAQSDPETNVLLAPSQIPERVHREIPHELELEQIAELVRAFGEAARRCRDGGL